MTEFERRMLEWSVSNGKLSRSNSAREQKPARGREALKAGGKASKREVYFLSPSRRRRRDQSASKRDSSTLSLRQSTFPRVLPPSRSAAVAESRLDAALPHRRHSTDIQNNASAANDIYYSDSNRSGTPQFSEPHRIPNHAPADAQGSLRRNKGRSSQSLCSCDAETEIIPDPDRPMCQYGVDGKKSHTYTCEQNAQILMRLERERQTKLGSTGKMNTLFADVDIIPPPPPPLRRNPSLSRHYPATLKTTVSPPSSTGENIQTGDCSVSLLNCATANITYELKTTKPDICNFGAPTVTKSVSTNQLSFMDNPAFEPGGLESEKGCQHFHENSVDHSSGFQKDDATVFFYHHEPPPSGPNFDTLDYPAKFNTIGPHSGENYHKLKGHSSSCNLSQFGHPHDGCYFSNSLTNFTLLPPGHHRPYSHFLDTSNTLGGSYTSTLSSGTLAKHQHSGSMPWRHRQCSSRASSSSGTSSTRWDVPSRHWLAVTSILLIAGAAGVAVPLALRVTAGAPLEERVEAATQLLEAVPLIDGHNDLPWNIRKFLHNQLNDFHFDEDLRNVMPWAKSTWSHTDLPRLRKGRVSAQFWAAYVPCEAQYRDAVQLTLEQIDVIKRLTERYSPELTTCASVADILEAHKNHQLCSLTGVEGGHSLGGSLGVLRTLYTVGVRYMTLTSTCHTPWADSSHDIKHGGLTAFGKTIIREMNRLGMIVDLSHVSVGTVRDALAVSDAPVIFSHSSAYEICNSSRNVQDDILVAVARNRGLVMVNFYSRFLSCSENATVHDAVAHINHIKRVAGIDHVGLGAGFDGINYTPKGLEDVSTYPMLFAELMGDGWTAEELTKLAGQNFLRVMSEVERVRDAQKSAGVRPHEEVPNFRLEDPYNCTSS
ncbi:uncharacterized protein LOC132262665 [Phlebotomus argentipes]|uniref:uncharacterized protein LOC132262665 n=1 Tax=Phlebotomus argentipes TaxID=94469 RepID=UPI00289341A1|nr:uncharacterized protein LOC132262665 [Phlebotomus argentipes]XP_059617985.1 uncharacterized protein LOC132262665 [Phlebotomus argentipes]XP_059617986.1 uncharacterized protein LOC132262665 [Phlebotomus argentipes]XP_059617987.1 uncharacterized protein LOC132262665 [Phlebotomus argentipes]